MIGGVSVAAFAGALENSDFRSYYNIRFDEAATFFFHRLQLQRHKTILASVSGSVLVLDCGTGSRLFQALSGSGDSPIQGVQATDQDKNLLKQIPQHSTEAGFPSSVLCLFETPAKTFLESQPANSYDSVIAEFSLSRMPAEEIPNTLNHIERVLRPGGKLYFIDRTKQPSLISGSAQALFNPLFSFFTSGRSLRRPIAEFLVGAPFEKIYIESWPRNIDRDNSRKGIEVVYSNFHLPPQPPPTELPPLVGLRGPAPLIAGIAMKSLTSKTAQRRDENAGDFVSQASNLRMFKL